MEEQLIKTEILTAMSKDIELYGQTNAEVKIIDLEAQVSGNDNDLFKA